MDAASKKFGPDEPLYNSRLIRNYVEYTTKYHPAVDIKEVLDYAAISRHELDDPAHWFTQSQVDHFHEILTRQTGQPDISREVGRYAASSQTSGAIRQYALGLLSPASAYRMLERITSNLSRASKFKTQQIGDNTVEVKVTLEPGVAEKPYQCENRMGLLESVAKVFTNRFATIEHKKCVHKGHQLCEYIIQWGETPSLAWKRMRNYLLLFSALGSLFLFFSLPLVSWVIFVLGCAVATGILSLYAAHLERKDLTQTIQTQGDAAKDLIDEMNMRYNSALLVQEIGQAHSGIRDTDTLCRTVIELMEKRLDFDRGMIMLATRDKKRLVHISGYGYSPEQEKLLEEAEFHLDNPESKGVFVRAFKDQKPFLVNDLAQDAGKLSSRSLSLARQMGVHSLVCVPIIYEKESLGIVAVDNVASKRVLTQSDMNLLMGVAAQTAASISEAISFQKLQENEKKYRELVENANSIILRINTRGDITFFNEYAQRLFGYAEKEIIGKDIRGTLLPDEESTAEDLQVLSQGLTHNPELPAVRERDYVLQDGRTVWIAWTNKPIFDDEGNLKEILSIGHDLTELKRAAREKKALEVQLQEAQKMEAIGTLAGGIAHDFNNILQAIFGYTQILLMRKHPKDPDYKNLEAIERSAQRASDLTKRLLIFGRKVESQLRPVDLEQEVVQVAKVLERTIPKMIRIDLDLAKDLGVINADPVQIEQIMMNLGVNARDAMPDGGILTFRTRTILLDENYTDRQAGAAPGKYVLLSVSDTGHGVSKEIQEHIFEPFFTTKETGKGTGLGLSMVYGIVQSHNGFISCDSEEGKGTTFNIYFPVLEEGPLSAETVVEEEAPLTKGAGTILLVDDEEAIRKPAEEMLREFGYNVITAADGETALEAYQNGNGGVDVVILDLIMPGMGGRQCMDKLLHLDPLAKIIIASGYSADGSIKEAIEAGAKGFVGKPWDVRHMLKVVKDVLQEGGKADLR